MKVIAQEGDYVGVVMHIREVAYIMTDVGPNTKQKADTLLEHSVVERVSDSTLRSFSVPAYPAHGNGHSALYDSAEAIMENYAKATGVPKP